MYQNMYFFFFFFSNQDKRIAYFDPASYTPADTHSFLRKPDL